MKNPAAVELGRRGGRKGGPARASKLSPKRRKEIAQQAASARWYRNPVPNDGPGLAIVDRPDLLPVGDDEPTRVTEAQYLPSFGHDLFDLNDAEITVVESQRYRIYPGGAVKFKILCCDGIGFHVHVTEEEIYATWCWCIYGHRLRCATPEDAWPMSFGLACRAADALGLRRAA